MIDGNIPESRLPPVEIRDGDCWASQLWRWVNGGLAISADLWHRFFLLGGALSLCKLVMLVSEHKSLFDAHWRVSPSPSGVGNWLAFAGFVGLVGVGIWWLGRGCETGEANKVRGINALVLLLGGSFLTMTFHEGKFSHLSSVIRGFLSPTDLWSYYSMNLFFRQPFLAVWLGGYVIIYYVLTRNGREKLMLRVTAVFAAVYVALYLQDLVSYRSELLVCNAFGVAGLLAWPRRNVALHPGWMLLPFVGLAGCYVRVRGFNDALAAPCPEAVMLVSGAAVVLLGASLLAWRRGGYAGWSWLLCFGSVALLLFSNANYPLADNYRNWMCLTLTWPRYFLGEMSLALLVLALGATYRRWFPRSSLFWLDFISLGLILVSVVDVRWNQILGARMDYNGLALALGEGPQMMWLMAKPYLPMIIATLGVGTMLYWGILRLFQRMARIEVNFGADWSGGKYAIIAFVLLGVVGRFTVKSDKVEAGTMGVLLCSSPVGRWFESAPMDELKFRQIAARLGMKPLLQPKLPLVDDHSHSDRALNVLFILQESTYNQHLSLFNGSVDTQPLFAKYRERLELFPNFFSSFAGSINAQFACFTGLYPVRDYQAFTFNHISVKSVFEVLHTHGYATSLFTSTYLDYTGFRDFLRGRCIDEMFDADTMPGVGKTNLVSWGLHEEDTLRVMCQQIDKYRSLNQKFFMTYIPVAPHNPFDGTPSRFRRFSLREYKDYTPLYHNELLYMDWVISSLVEKLKEAGLLDDTLIVITGDHGEMLGANHGPIGHGWALTPELANIPLIIMNPNKRGYRVNDTVGSQVDLLPTILDLLNLPQPAGSLCQGGSLYSAEAQQERLIYLNTFQQYGILQGRRLICGNRVEGGSGAGQCVVTMTNAGAHTLFLKSDSTSSPPSIKEFDAFQENFLRNYSYYEKMLSQPPVVGATSQDRKD